MECLQVLNRAHAPDVEGILADADVARGVALTLRDELGNSRSLPDEVDVEAALGVFPNATRHLPRQGWVDRLERAP